MSQLQVNRINDASGGVLAPISSVMRNRIINGAMVIDQRNAGASIASPSDNYTTDRFYSRQVGGGVASAQQSSTAPAGFTNSLLFTVTTADSSIVTTDRYYVAQFIEGYNIADLGWGTANAKTVTLSFWVRSSVTGTFGGAIRNSGASRSYPFTYTVSSANTWTQAVVTISGDTSGTWLTTNGTGMQIMFGIGMGSTYSGTAGAWASADYLSATGSTNLIATNGATFYITGVQLEVGTQATSFEYRQYGTELNLCQRYFQIVGGTSTEHFATGVMNTNRINIIYGLKQTMRASPSFSATSFGSSFSDLTIYAGVTTYAVTGSSENYMATNNVSIGFTHGGLSTAGDAGYIYFNSTAARVAFTAEL